MIIISICALATHTKMWYKPTINRGLTIQYLSSILCTRLLFMYWWEMDVEHCAFRRQGVERLTDVTAVVVTNHNHYNTQLTLI